MMPDWLLLTLGGAAGTNARYWLGRWILSQLPIAAFPWGTFTINVSGSLAIALLALLLPDRAEPAQRPWHLLLSVGFCGGYTTFSAFSYESWLLLERRQYLPAILYIAGSVAAGIFAVAAVMSFKKS